MVKKINRFFRTLAEIALIGGTLAFANYKIAHRPLEIINNQDGTHTYKHKDKRTTHFLNVLAGVEKFNENDFLISLKKEVEYICKEEKIKSDKSLKKMSINELEEFVIKSSGDSTLKKGFLLEYIHEEVEHFNKIDTTKVKQNKNLYELVWQLEKECGNPKIRFVSEDMNFTPISDYQNNVHYGAFNNTIYLYPYDIKFQSNSNGIIPEMSHAKQFNDDQIASYIKFLSDCISIMKKSIVNKIPIANEYRKSYSEPGSFEHEAHEIIEPYLQKKYPLYVDKKEHSKE